MQDRRKKIKDGASGYYTVPLADFKNNSLLKVYSREGKIDKLTIKISIFILSFPGFCL